MHALVFVKDTPKLSTLTVSNERYLRMLQDFFLPQIRILNAGVNSVWFQEDGNTMHTASISMNFLQQWSISHYGDVFWPLRSPNITCAELFLIRVPETTNFSDTLYHHIGIKGPCYSSSHQYPWRYVTRSYGQFPTPLRRNA